jgi:hypothetical protein
MKEIREILLEQKEKDDTTLNYVSREAQEAILHPDFSDSIKEEILIAAVGTINQIAERRWIYEVISRKDADLKQSHTIYEANEGGSQPDNQRL